MRKLKSFGLVLAKPMTREYADKHFGPDVFPTKKGIAAWQKVLDEHIPGKFDKDVLEAILRGYALNGRAS